MAAEKSLKISAVRMDGCWLDQMGRKTKESRERVEFASFDDARAWCDARVKKNFPLSLPTQSALGKKHDLAVHEFGSGHMVKLYLRTIDGWLALEDGDWRMVARYN